MAFDAVVAAAAADVVAAASADAVSRRRAHTWSPLGVA